MSIDTLIIDFGKVLCDSSWSRVMAGICNIKPGLTKSDIYDFVFPRFLDYERGRYGRIEFWSMIEKEMNIDVGLPPGEFLSECYKRILLDYNEDVIRILEEVRDSGIRCCLLSNACEEISASVLNDERLRAIFEDRMYFSNAIGERKPHPEAYLAVLNGAECKAENALFVDDLQRNVDGAIDVGIKAVVFTDAWHLRMDLRDHGLL